MEERIVSFKEGDQVRVQGDIGTPKYEWGNVSPGEIGIVKQLVNSEHMLVDFPSQDNWNADPADMELANDASIIPQELFDSGLVEVVEHLKKRKSADKVLAYGIILKDGSFHSSTTDREIARTRKAALGGKQAGVTIVVLKAGKEIR